MRTLSAGAAIALAMLAAGGAEAATCQIITYFSDAAHMRAVGSWSNCPGQKGLQGMRTRFFERETEEIHSSPPIGGGHLPCEFLASGCSPIPGPR